MVVRRGAHLLIVKHRTEGTPADHRCKVQSQVIHTDFRHVMCLTCQLCSMIIQGDVEIPCDKFKIEIYIFMYHVQIYVNMIHLIVCKICLEFSILGLKRAGDTCDICYLL